MTFIQALKHWVMEEYDPRTEQVGDTPRSEARGGCPTLSSKPESARRPFCRDRSICSEARGRQFRAGKVASLVTCREASPTARRISLALSTRFLLAETGGIDPFEAPRLRWPHAKMIRTYFQRDERYLSPATISQIVISLSQPLNPHSVENVNNAPRTVHQHTTTSPLFEFG